MTYHQRLPIFIFLDSCTVLFAIFFSMFLVNATYNVVTVPIAISSVVFLLSHLFFSVVFRLYRKAWKYASVGELTIIVKTGTVSIFVAGIVEQLLFHDIYYRLLVVTWLLNILLIGGSRFCWRIYQGTALDKTDNKKRTLIVGAGSAGMMVARQLSVNNEANLLPVGFIDDDVKKQKLEILGIPVLGGVEAIQRVAEQFNINNIIISIPSLSKRQLNTIFQECVKTKAKTQILPMLEDLVTGKVSVKQFRDIQVEDLLGRETVELNLDSISEYTTNKIVLVTGAGGSIGSEICRQIISFSPKKLVLLGHGENSIYTIGMELKEKIKNSKIELASVIADLQDEKKMIAVMRTHKPDVVYHAAAHKHVPLMEENPEEAVKNNLIGTRNTARAASWNGVKTFVMVSTDKAVNPTSVMGATKHLAEMIVQSMDQQSETKFVVVRFGNVLGSRGSVIPLFKKQIENGGPVTVTHPDMERYFMTIPEASRLVIQAGALAKGGETFVLDMGEPVKIVDLAKNIIKLSGNSIEDIGIEFTGVRPGEKLYEELLNKDEIHEEQIYPKIYIGKTTALYLSEIDEIIFSYQSLGKEELRQKLLDLANHRTGNSALSPMPV